MIYFFTAALSNWDFFHGKFMLLSPGKASYDRVTIPTYGACWVFYCIHYPLNSNMDRVIFYVYTDVNACNCTRGCTDTVRKSALRADAGRKIPCRTVRSKLRGAARGLV